MPAPSARRSNRLLWAGLAFLLAGVAAYFTGQGLGALSSTICKNQFSLSAANSHCSSPLYWIYAGFALLALGVGGVFIFVLRRRLNRNEQPVA
jgi:hypothetical protein